MRPLRCFFAIEVPREHVDVFGRAAARLVELDPSWAGEKWVAPELIHITLVFMPAVPADDVAGLLDEARLSLADSVPISLEAHDRVRAVPSPRRARMLWASYGEPGQLSELASRVRTAAAPYVDPPGSTRPFVAHATLCRARKPRPVAEHALDEAGSCLAEASLTPVSVSGVTLFSSTLGPHGPSYETLGRIAFERD